MQHQGCINYDMTLYKLELDYIHYKFTRIRMYYGLFDFSFALITFISRVIRSLSLPISCLFVI